VCTEWQTRKLKLNGAGDTKLVREQNRPEPFDLGLARFGARDIDDDPRPRAATVADCEFHVDGAVFKEQRFSLPSEREALIGVAGQGRFQGAREISVRVLENDINV